MKDSRLAALRVVLGIVGITQVIFGLTELLVPAQFHQFVGYSQIPPWAIFTSRLGSVRFLALAFGIYLAIRDPRKHIAWIQVMIFVHAMDFLIAVCAWTSTLCPTIPFMRSAIPLWLPLLLVALLIVFYPKGNSKDAVSVAGKPEA